MAAIYKNYSSAIWGLTNVAATGTKNNPFGLTLTGFDNKADASDKQVMDENGEIVGEVLYSSKTTITIDGWAVTEASVPCVGDIVEFSATNGLATVANKTIGGTTAIAKAHVKGVNIKSSNEDVVTVSLDCVYYPNLSYPTQPAG